MSSVCPFLSHTELTELTEKRGPAVILCFPCAFIRDPPVFPLSRGIEGVHSVFSVVSVCPIPLRIAQINRIICCCCWTRQPRRGEGLQTGVSPPVSDAQYKEALKGRKIFRAFSTPFIGSNINGDYHLRL